MQYRIRRLLLLTLYIALCSTAAVAQSLFTFEKITDSNSAAPGQAAAVFSVFQAPSLGGD